MDCSLAYYYSRVLHLPEKQWARTAVGSLIHSIFECLRHPRHRHHYDTITAGNRVDYKRSPAVARLVRAWKVKHQITGELLEDLNDMLYVGLILLDFYWTKADKDPITNAPLTYGPEYEFILILDDGTEIKGIIDDMAVVDGVMHVRDFKSAKQKPTKAEVPNTIQAIIYQLYVWIAFKLPARVEFVYLRHPPTARVPDRHLQVVQPASSTHLEGLIEYVKVMSARANKFTLEDALVSPLDDYGFCRNVCTHYAPHDYWVVCSPEDPKGIKPLSSHLSLTAATESSYSVSGSTVLMRRHEGCLSKWRG